MLMVRILRQLAVESQTARRINILDAGIHHAHKSAMHPLSQFLQSSGTKQDDFALSVGCSQATVSRLIRGRGLPSLALAVAIERETSGKVPASCWFAGGEDAAGGAHEKVGSIS